MSSHVSHSQGVESISTIPFYCIGSISLMTKNTPFDRYTTCEKRSFPSDSSRASESQTACGQLQWIATESWYNRRFRSIQVLRWTWRSRTHIGEMGQFPMSATVLTFLELSDVWGMRWCSTDFGAAVHEVTPVCRDIFGAQVVGWVSDEGLQVCSCPPRWLNWNKTEIPLGYSIH